MKNSLASLESLKKIFTYGERIRPVRDWFVLLAITTILLIIGVFWNIYIFNQFENVKTPASDTHTPQLQNLETSVQKVQTIFQSRATEENNYQQTYQFVDPS
jgi:hypothetical protein